MICLDLTPGLYYNLIKKYVVIPTKEGFLMPYSPIILQSPLFAGISKEDIDSMLSCLSARNRQFQKGEIIFPEGQPVSSIGLLTSGTVHIMKEDYWGRSTLMGQISPGECFGEAYACAPGLTFPFTAVAMADSSVLFLDINRVMTVCSSSCQFHSHLIRNLLSVLAESNLRLAKKIESTSPRTIREKLLSYLSVQARQLEKTTFQIPFTRQQLADYLCIDRSAMTVELYKLQKEGVISFEKNKFTLL